MSDSWVNASFMVARGGPIACASTASEFPAGTARLIKHVSPTASVENELSVWLTEDALVRTLHDVGFSETEKVVCPQQAGT